jgi:peroxidase
MSVQSGGMAFDMPTGRLDGMISSVQDASDNLPGTTLSAKEMTQQFAQHGLTQDEMVTLAGKSRAIIITIASTY